MQVKEVNLKKVSNGAKIRNRKRLAAVRARRQIQQQLNDDMIGQD